MLSKKLSPLSLATDVTDATLGASGLWLGTQTGAGGTATLNKSFFGRSPWLHGQQDVRVFMVLSLLCSEQSPAEASEFS